MEKTKSTSHGWMALASMCVMTIVWVGIGWNTVTLYADPIVTQWGISRTAFMLTVTLIAGGNTLVSLFFYGQLEAKLGIRKLLLLGGILSTVSFATFALASNIVMLYVAAILFGVGVSVLNNNTFMTAINYWFKKRQGTMISVATTCASVSGIIFATVFGFVIAVMGWRTGFWITAGVSAVATVVTFALYKGDPEKLGEKAVYEDDAIADDVAEVAEEEDGIGYSAMFKTPQFYLLILAFLLIGIVCFAAFTNLALFAADLGFGELAGTVLSVTLLASALTMIPGGVVCDKLGTKWMVAISMVLLIVGMFVLRMDGISLVMLYVAAALLGIGYNASQIPSGNAVREAFGTKEYSKKLGTCAGFLFMGVAFSPTVMSLFFDLTGDYNTALLVMIVGSVAAALLMFPATRRVKDK